MSNESERDVSEPDQPRVFVTRRIPEIGITRVASVCKTDVWPEDLPPSRETLLEKVSGCHALLTLLSDRIDGEVMDAAGPDLKVISNYAVGFNNIDVEEATKRGIRVGNTPGVLTDATADIAAALLFAVGRKIIESNHAVHNDEWKTWEPLGYIGTDLVGKTIGIVGMGRIGYAMAKRFHCGWDMQVLYTSRSEKQDANENLNARRVDFDTLLKESDFVSVHTALNESTSGLFDKAAFEQMKSSALFINTSRGQVHNQKDLAEALKSGQIAGAGLDVTEVEPIPQDDELLTLPNCVIVPHIGSATHATRDAMAEIAADNVLLGLEDKPLRHGVNEIN